MQRRQRANLGKDKVRASRYALNCAGMALAAIAAGAFARVQRHRGKQHRVQEPECGEAQDETEDDHGSGETTK